MPTIARVSQGARTWFKSVIYLDKGIIVLNKPAGLVCQSSRGNQEGPNGSQQDLIAQVANDQRLDDVLDDLKQRLRLPDLPLPLHRLDKSTTGTLVLARTPPVARALSQQFQVRDVHKTYLALVRGGEQSFPGTSGEIRTPLKFTDGRVSLAGAKAGKMAATDWQLLGSSKKAPLSLLRLTLHTGLKHQLRVHLSDVLHAPVLGDAIHGSSKVHSRISSQTKFAPNRMFLHASHISFYRYKASGGSKRFRLGITAPLPPDFRRICSDLEIPLNKADIEGGVFVDDIFVEGGEVPELQGSWVLS